jgi:hypothetical protein
MNLLYQVRNFKGSELKITVYVMSHAGWPIRLWSCHYERSGESAFVGRGTTVLRKQQIPHGQKAVRDDNSKSPDIAYAAVIKANPQKSIG